MPLLSLKGEIILSTHTGDVCVLRESCSNTFCTKRVFSSLVSRCYWMECCVGEGQLEACWKLVERSSRGAFGMGAGVVSGT
jgi:hypothetical protein